MPNELVPLVSDLINDRDIFVVDVFGAPLEFVERPWPRLGGLPEVSSRMALIFCLDRPQMGARSIYDFLKENSDALKLRFGALNSEGLTESWISSTASESSSSKRWRQFKRKILPKLLSGAEAVNPVTGARGAMKWHRFTQAAQDAYLSGTRILPPAGGNVIIELPRPR